MPQQERDAFNASIVEARDEESPGSSVDGGLPAASGPENHPGPDLKVVSLLPHLKAGNVIRLKMPYGTSRNRSREARAVRLIEEERGYPTKMVAMEPMERTDGKPSTIRKEYKISPPCMTWRSSEPGFRQIT